MKKRLIYILMGLLLVSGCGSKTEISSQPSMEDVADEQENLIDYENENKSEETEMVFVEETPVPEENVKLPTVNPIQLYKDYIADETWGKTEVICSSKRDIIKIFDDERNNYPKLNNTLEKISMETSEQVTNFMNENEVYALTEDGNEYFGGFQDESKIYVQRADDVIISIRESAYQYTGGAHPMYSFGGININPTTGEVLQITDIFKDFSKLIEVLSEKLTNKYGEEWFYSSPKELLDVYTPEKFTWSVGYQGITFYFSPYELAPYAAGSQMVTVWFDEAKEWIDEKYMASPKGGYVAELPIGEEIHLEFNRENEEKDTLVLGRNYIGETGDVFNLSFSVNEEVYLSEETFYDGDLEASLVSLTDQGRDRFYLYVKYTIETTDLYVYELTNEGVKFQGSVSNVNMPGKVLDQWDPYNQTQMYLEQVFTDPSEFTFISRMYLMGFMDGVKTYYADPSDGMPKATTEYYVLPENFATLTSIRDLEVEILPENNMETVEKGTNFVYLRTDNESYIDFRMDDGRECRVHFEKKDWDKTINGYLPEECFENISNYF